MNITTILAGTIVTAIGIYALYKSVKTPEKVAKLKAMRGMIGSSAGTAIYTIVYAVLPIVFGSFAVKAGYNGVSLMQFISAQ
jgi:hypothetical protein